MGVAKTLQSKMTQMDRIPVSLLAGKDVGKDGAAYAVPGA